MKIVVIHGQQHKGNTYFVTHMLLNKFNCKKEDIQEFFVNGMPQCIGCYKCILQNENLCPHIDTTKPIIKAMETSDVIILASPCYCFGMTGQLKSFLDHLGYAWTAHRPYDMKNKIGVVISTAAGGGSNKVTKSLAEQLFWLSVGKIYQLPFVVHADKIDSISNKNKQKLDKKIQKISNIVNMTINNSKPNLKAKIYFKIMAIYHKKMPWNEIETNYWKSKGWI